jgi:hypothetical protein
MVRKNAHSVTTKQLHVKLRVVKAMNNVLSVSAPAVITLIDTENVSHSQIKGQQFFFILRACTSVCRRRRGAKSSVRPLLSSTRRCRTSA